MISHLFGLSSRIEQVALAEYGRVLATSNGVFPPARRVIVVQNMKDALPASASDRERSIIPLTKNSQTISSLQSQISSSRKDFIFTISGKKSRVELKERTSKVAG